MKSMTRKMGRQAVSVVNFEAMNRVPPQDGLLEARGEIVPGMENVWYEYVPKNYDGTRPLPLVVQLHGGGNDGRRWAGYTVWHALAERLGLIVIYPNSPDYESWACQEREIQYLCDLIRHVSQKYNIDRSRVYMQGMSNGDMMTLAFSMAHPEMLAAAGYATGPTHQDLLGDDRPTGALPIIQMRGELDINWMLTPETKDIFAMRYAMNDLNREIWLDINGARDCLPALSIQGKDNFLVYPGKNAPLINWEIVGMGHREPVNGAQVFWDRLYSGCRREEGRIALSEPAAPLRGDDDTVVVCMGSNKLYRRDGIVPFGQGNANAARMFVPAEVSHFCPVRTGEMCETEVLCVPAEFFAAAFGAQIRYADAGETCEMTLTDGRRVILRSQAVLYECDGAFRALQKPCVLLCGSFYVPVGELCQQLFGSHVSQADDALCVSGHYAVLGRYTASILRALLGGEMRPRQR